MRVENVENLDQIYKSIEFANVGNNSVMMNSENAVMRVNHAANLCIFGLGRFLYGYAFAMVERASYLSDNDPDKWGNCYHNKLCVPPSSLVDIEGLVVLVTIAKPDDIIRQLKSLGLECYSFYEYSLNVYSHISEYSWSQNDIDKVVNAYSILCDDASRAVFANTLSNRIAPHLAKESFFQIQSSGEYFSTGLLQLTDCEDYIDAGAYTGDSITSFIKAANNEYKRIIGFEMDVDNFQMLKACLAGTNRLYLYNLGLSDCTDIASYSSNKTGSRLDGTGEGRAQLVRLDDCINGSISMIKMDIEGSELAALNGGHDLIARQKPKLAISAYHNLSDLWEIPLWIYNICPDYMIGLRHHSPLSWDTNCYASTSSQAK